MNSLEQLNNYSQTSFSVTDDRDATVIFDRDQTVDANNQVLNITSQEVNVDPGIEIVEIVNYATANVRYEITITESVLWTPFSSTIQWTAIPGHITYNKSGNIYTLTGLRDVNDWNAVKSFVWNLPAGFSVGNLWYLTVKVIWYDEAAGTDKERSWLVFDPDHYQIAQLNIVAQITCNPRKIFRASASLVTAVSFECEEGIAKNFKATLSSSASITCSAVDAFFDIAVTKNFIANKIVRPTSTMNTVATANIVGTAYNAITNITLSRNFLSGVGNSVFSSNTPVVDDPDPSAQITFTISCTDGEFGTDYSSSNNYTYTGTPSQINSLFSQIKFYPNPGFNSSTFFTYTQSKVSGYNITKTANLIRTGSSTPIPRKYTLTTSGTWQPLREEFIYTVMDYLIVGAGGGCDSNGAGGGGGQVVEYTNQTISLTSYPYTIGTGGIVNGGAGGSTIFNSITMVGGQPGSQSTGGTSGNGFTGGSTAGSGGSTGGGGGGGAISNGLNGTVISGNGISGAGGTGYASDISGTTRRYAAGGYGTASGNQQPTVPGYTTDYGGGGRSQLSGTGFPTIAAEPGQNGVVIIRTHV